MHFLTLISTISLYLSAVAAWPWPPVLSDLSPALLFRDAPLDSSFPSAPLLTSLIALDLIRQADDTTTATTRAAASTSAAASTAAETGTTATKTDSKPTAAKSIPQDAPAGGFTMVTPAQTSQTFAKIGAEITFVWNYTSLLAPPSAVDVVASNTAGVWTIANNISAKETSVVWNTSNEATSLPMESYMFMIYDSELGATSVPKPGHLSPYIGYGFAMYSPKPPVKATDFYCVTCSGAMTTMERQSLAVILGTCTLTVLSFTYFSCGFLGVL